MNRLKQLAILILEVFVISAVVLMIGGVSAGILFGAAVTAALDSVARKLEKQSEISYIYFWHSFKRMIKRITPIWIPMYLFLILFIFSMFSVTQIGSFWPYWLAMQSLLLGLLLVFMMYFFALAGRYTMKKREALILAYQLTFRYIHYNVLVMAVIAVTGYIILLYAPGFLIVFLGINLLFQGVMARYILMKTTIAQHTERQTYQVKAYSPWGAQPAVPNAGIQKKKASGSKPSTGKPSANKPSTSKLNASNSSTNKKTPKR